MFVFTIFFVGRWLPASKGAPQVGQRVPDFSLPDTSGKQVSLNELLTTPVNGNAPKGVLLVFYAATGDRHVTPSCGVSSEV